jgi:hypothetical protein
VASLPICPDATFAPNLSPPEVLARAPMNHEERRDPPFYPFDPRLIPQPNGALMLLWTPAHGSSLEDSGGNKVLARTLSGGQWSAPEALAQGGGSHRFFLDAIAGTDGKPYAAWCQGDYADVQGIRIAGTVSSNGSWSDVVALTDPAATRWLDFNPPSLLAGPDGRVHLFWMDHHEEHWYLSLAHPGPEGYTKVFHRNFGGAAEAPTEQVTAKGKFNVDLLAPVRDPHSKRVEIVFFKKGRNDWGPSVARGKKGFYLVSSTKDGWSEPVRLVPTEDEPGRVEKVDSPDALRNVNGDLFLAYHASLSKPDGRSAFAGELRVLRQSPSGSVRVHSIANGVEYPFSRTSIRMIESAGGSVNVVYQGAISQWSERFRVWMNDYRRGEPLYLVRTDGESCQGATQVAPSTISGLFDIAADSEGRIHVVWVADDGDDAVLMHRWIELSPAARSTPGE